MAGKKAAARRAYESGSSGWVGQFFELLAFHLLGGEKPEHGDGDLVLWDKGLGFEVKGSDSRHCHRLATEHQLEHYLRISAGFPLRGYYYLLFGYKNPMRRWSDKSRHTLLSLHSKDKFETWRFVAQHADWLWVLDARIVQAIRETYGIHTMSIPCHPGCKTVDIPRWFLKLLFTPESTEDAMRELNLYSSDWDFRYAQLAQEIEIGKQSAGSDEPPFHKVTVRINLAVVGSRDHNLAILEALEEQGAIQRR